MLYVIVMKKWINVPNTLSIIRILTIPAIVLLIIYSTTKNYPILIGVYFFSIWLDFFDGYLARKLSQETELGKILDPVADKLMIAAIVIALVIKTDFPLWLAIIILLRDLVILVAASIISREKHTITPSLLAGKVTFALLGALIMVYILDLYQYIDLTILKRFFISLSCCFLAWSFVEYYKVYEAYKRGKNA
jgi:CDP-diacylglycerol--glycerol-3-phosphate 3-phosphatidyltransferase